MDGTTTVTVPEPSNGAAFTLPDSTQKMRGISVQNNSDATVQLTFGTLVPQPQIDVTVPTNTYQSIPLASIGAVWINVVGGTAGTVYIHGTTDLVNAFTTQVVQFNLAGVAFSATPPVSLVIGGTPANPTYTYGLQTPLAQSYGGTGSASGAWSATSLALATPLPQSSGGTGSASGAWSATSLSLSGNLSINGAASAGTGLTGGSGTGTPLNLRSATTLTSAAPYGVVIQANGSPGDLVHFFYGASDVAQISSLGAMTLGSNLTINGGHLTMPSVVSNGVVLTPSADGNLAMISVTNAASTISILRFDSIDANNGILYQTYKGNLANLVPCQNAAGTQQASGFHMCYGTSAGTGGTVSVTLTHGYTSATSYMALIFLSATTIVASIVDATHFSFPTTSGQTYNWVTIGT